MKPFVEIILIDLLTLYLSQFPGFPDPGSPWESILGTTTYLVHQAERLLDAKEFSTTSADKIFDYYVNHFSGQFFFLSFNVETHSYDPSPEMAILGDYGLSAFLPLFNNLITVYKRVPRDTAASLRMIQSLPQKMTRVQELVDWRLRQHEKWAFDAPDFWVLQNYLFTDPDAKKVIKQVSSITFLPLVPLFILGLFGF